MFKLVIQDDEGKTTVVPLIRDEITIGRKEGNTIRLTERNVSRRHARIVRNNGEVQIEDLGSYNGIRVNNARIAERVSLRVSDQVQIGDYKLYLKAEGVEQVDDARTMPIERVETATEVMPSVGAAPTAPLPVAAPSPGMGTPPPMTRGNAMGVADTDPAGRPVATAAQVAALTTPTGYGKLVVVSSNFAGREFDLSRPQMIVGRTDENDIVINHRSISRNHAKVTRDTETNRYTISDLQSSNGVRVNGQDYGKVELRRGDQIDLGHVRLRFVEPGEDFIFSRDAVIADVPEEGSKRGVLVAVILAVLVIGSVGAFFALKSGGGGGSGSENGNNATTGPGSQVAVADKADAQVVIPETPGSNTMAATPDALPPTPTNDETDQLRIECMGYEADKKWQDLLNCSTKLGPKDKARSKEFYDKAKAEQHNELTLQNLQDAVKEGNLKSARKLVDSIDQNSVYQKPAQDEYNKLEKATAATFGTRAKAMKGKCPDIEQLYKQAQQQGGAVADAVRPYRCETPPPPPPQNCSAALLDPKDKKCHEQFCAANSGDARCQTGNGSAQAAPACDADELMSSGEQSYEIGQYGVALKKFEAAVKCKGDPRAVQKAFMAACQATQLNTARVYWRRLSEVDKNRLMQICARAGYKRDDLDKP